MFLRQNSNNRMMSLTGSTVLSLRVGSFSSRSLITPRVGSTGNEVNSADTSLELRHSPGANVNCLTCSTVMGAVNMVWGFTYQGFKDLGKFFGHTIDDLSITGQNRP